MSGRQRIAVFCAAVGIGAAVLTVGCADLMDQILGSSGGLLFYGLDVATTPGTEVNLQAILVRDNLLADQTGRTVKFMMGDELLGSAKTDSTGMATIQWTPTTVGDHLVTLSIEGEQTDAEADQTETPEPVQMLVACREANVPIAIIDLDQTLVASGFWDVFSGGAEDPTPMEGSEDVVKRMAKDYFIIYLTHRPDQFTLKSKGWLKGHGYPLGPVMLSRATTTFAQGSGTFKTEAIANLGTTFTNLKVGIGDKDSDVEAYHTNGMEGILVRPLPAEGTSASDIEAQADAIEALPEDIQVVEDWAGVEKVLYEGADFKRAKRVETLRKMAADLKTS